MREQWNCPDLGQSTKARALSVPGSGYTMDVCPASFLRTAADVEELRVRRGIEPFAEHLIGGAVHPDSIIQVYAFEVETGSRTVDSLSNKSQELVKIRIGEKAARDRYEDELRKKETESNGVRRK